MQRQQSIPPSTLAGYRVWRVDATAITILFVGRGPQPERGRALRDIAGARSPRLAWLKQTHSATVHAAAEGLCGEGDGLITSKPHLALSVATADCLPVVLAGERHLATVHAGWRGLVAGILPATVRAMLESPAGLRVWIGPAIGACCYEVGVDVAESVAAVSGPEVIVSTSRRPRLDLVRAAEVQLALSGVTAVSSIPTCTRCSPSWLASYRRNGARAGRNWTFAWRHANEER